MKKGFRMLLAAALSASVAISAAGCASQPSEAPAESQAGDEAEAPAEGEEETDIYKIGVLQLVPHDALDKAREGFVAALEAEGVNAEFDIQNAQNDQSNLKTMSQKFVNDNVDLIFAIATPAAQSAATETSEIPIVGSAITDYVEAGLVDTNEAPGGNVTGTSDKTPVKEQFDLMMEILPDVKTVGIMYNSSEVNSEIQANLAKEAADALNLNYVIGTVTNVNDIPQVTESLMGKVDALYIPTDNTFASAMPLVSGVATENKTPIICGEVGMCTGGGFATVGIDYYKLGEQTGKMAARILAGEDVSTMPVEFTEIADICINTEIAEELGIEVPQEILDSAAYAIENGELVEK